MKLIYIPTQMKSVLQIETPDDLDYYNKLCKIMSCTVSDKVYTGYCIKQKRARKKITWDGKIQFIQEAAFLSGFTFMIEKIMCKLNIPYDLSIIGGFFELNTNSDLYNTLRPVQKDIVESLEKHCIKYGFIRKLINVPIGAGKSFLIENFSKLFPNTTSILVVDSLNLYKQYIENGVVSVKDSGIKKHCVNMMMTTFYKKHFSEIAKGLKEIDFLLLDEVHLNAIKSVVEKYPVNYLKRGLIGFTATLPDYPLERMNMCGYISSSVYIKKYEEVYSYFPTVRIINNSHKPCTAMNIAYNTLCKHIVTSTLRMRKIHQIIERHADKKILISVDKIENNLIPLYEYLNTAGVKVKYIHGKMEVGERAALLKLLQQGEIHVLIASSVTKAGINLEEVDILILNSYYVSSIPVIQFVGRLIRKDDPSIAEKIFYDIYDSAYRVFRTQISKRIKIYKKMGWRVVLDRQISDR